ncbi:MAG: hypothetical protein AB1631_21950 [Acidobacteriota bacterium]
MKGKLFAFASFVCLMLFAIASAQSPLQFHSDASANERASGKGKEAASSENSNPLRDVKGTSFDLSRIDESVVKEFQKAWLCTGGGTTNSEGLVLIFRKVDGSYIARAGECINEFLKFSFKWHPAAIAIVHSHPYNRDPRPTRRDEEIADKFRVPIFTITLQGMFMYDPTTKKTTKVMHDQDWLKADSFRKQPGRQQP